MSLHVTTPVLSSQHTPFTFNGVERARGIAYSRHKGPRGSIRLTQEFVDLLLPRQSVPKKVIQILLEGRDPFVVSIDQKFVMEDGVTMTEAGVLCPGDRLLGLKSLVDNGGSYIVQSTEIYNDMKPSRQLLDVSTVRFSNYALASGVFVHR
jgi:hypothetical protein